MKKNTAAARRKAILLFNFWLKKRQNDKRIGDLTAEDFIEMCEFLATSEDKAPEPPPADDDKPRFLIVNTAKQPKLH
jgi:hypothetical protein